MECRVISFEKCQRQLALHGDKFAMSLHRIRKMAGVAGLEPVTSAVTGQRSNQLSYTPAKRGINRLK